MHPGQHGVAPQPAGSNTQLGAALMLVAGICVLVGVLSKSFATASWDEGTESISFGFLGAEVCDGDECKELSWDQMGKVDGDIKMVRILGLLSGFGAAGLCAVAAFMAFSNKRPPMGAVQGVMGVAAFSYTFFLIRFMSEGRGEMSPGPGYAAFLGIGGLIMGSIVNKTMFKHLPAGGAPGQAYSPPGGYPPPPPPPTATAPCTRCGQAAQFVAQYPRWYCPSCQQYL